MARLHLRYWLPAALLAVALLSGAWLLGHAGSARPAPGIITEVN